MQIINRLILICLIFSLSSLLPAQERSIRYTPDGEAFVITNGKIKHNRALYGNNSGFRVESGDIPEFAFYLPGMGGNMHFAIKIGKEIKWLNDFDSIEARYIPGKRIYILKDQLLGNNQLILEALATYQSEGLILKFSVTPESPDITIVTVYGGSSAKRFSRNGDLNADPPDVFDLKPAYCEGNEYTIEKNAFKVAFGQNTKRGTKVMWGVFPEKSILQTVDAQKLENLSALINSTEGTNTPVLMASTKLKQPSTYFYIQQNKPETEIDYNQLAEIFNNAEIQRQELVQQIEIQTPDPYINTLGGVLSTVGDAIWDGKTYQHGAVGWRIPLPGWRAAYVADVMGWHDRAKTHFSAYALSQVTEPASGPMVMDTSRHLARGEEKMGNSMFTSGYICRKPGGDFRPHHYDMNLVFIDELLWHFKWTGDTAYVQEMWPLIKRHLAWEKRNFDPDNDGLYDAYACIWASDALQYSSGAVTHSSAYNYRSNKMAAQLASILGENPEPYQQEADKILKAINKRLWMPKKGWWAEYQEFFEKKQLHDASAVWTIYHAIDSDIHDPFQAYQALRYIDHHIPHIPVIAPGLEKDSLFVVSTTNWAPYSWSINNVAFAEILHTSLAYWQGGRNETAFKLWKGGIMDAMYLGSSPGNVGQISYYDAARGETYRDFADPTGMLARSTIQGLFGVKPNLLEHQVIIEPGFPAKWDSAFLNTPDLSFEYFREEYSETYYINFKSLKGNELVLRVPALTNEIKSVLVNNEPVTFSSDENSISNPKIIIDCGVESQYTLEITWAGNPFPKSKNFIAEVGDKVKWAFSYNIDSIVDPQSVFTDLAIPGNELQGNINGLPGHRTAFAKVKSGQLSYWLPLHIEIKDTETIQQAVELDLNTNQNVQPDFIELSKAYNAKISDIFKNKYLSPRSPYVTLQIPWQGIGEWCHPHLTENIDESGMMQKAAEKDNIYTLPNGIPFKLQTDTTKPNIFYTSLWDNYPDSITIDLQGKASHLCLLMAGSTNHMQSRFVNGKVIVNYTDGSQSVLELINPTTWCPIEQDYYHDGLAFNLEQPRPWRIQLKTGKAFRDGGKELGLEGVYTRQIDGGAATVLDLPLDPDKELKNLKVITTAYEVIIGLSAATLIR